MIRALLTATLALTAQDPGPRHPWTVLVWGASDNDSEGSFCPDVEALRRGLPEGGELEVLCLVDRSPDYSDSPEGFGEDFADTRLYRLTRAGAERLGGGEHIPPITPESEVEEDTGDALLLRDFIRWGKATSPARRYALLFYTHGSGWLWSPDESSDGMLHPAELSAALTAEESVDLVVFDVCEMSSLEDMVQWRPGPGRFSADVMVATPMAGFPFPWDRILRGIQGGGAEDGRPGLEELGPEDFGRAVVEATRADRLEKAREEGIPLGLWRAIGGEAMACVDLRRVAETKSALDALATEFGALEDGGRELLASIRGDDQRPRVLTYAPSVVYVDVFDVATRIAGEARFSEPVRARARELAAATDALVLESFGGASYDGFGGFLPGRHGVQLVFPPFGVPEAMVWSEIAFLSPERIDADRRLYGAYDFCRDGAQAGDGRVTNWFELLDLLFDPADERNGYRR